MEGREPFLQLWGQRDSNRDFLVFLREEHSAGHPVYQQKLALATNVPTAFISSSNAYTTGFDNNANALFKTSPIPTVYSLSYSFYESVLPCQDANNLCNIYMQLGARGVSVIVAGSRRISTCANFVPTFPASCPTSAPSCRQEVFQKKLSDRSFKITTSTLTQRVMAPLTRCTTTPVAGPSWTCPPRACTSRLPRGPRPVRQSLPQWSRS